MASLLDQLLDLLELFIEIATADPVSPLLLAAGAAIVSVSIAIVGVLFVGAVLETLGSPFE